MEKNSKDDGIIGYLDDKTEVQTEESFKHFGVVSCCVFQNFLCKTTKVLMTITNRCL